jgi:hypothetical protein
MRSCEVGKLFEEGKTHYQEGVKFDFTQSGPILFLFFNRPTQKEVESVKTGKFEYGLYVKDEVIFLFFKFQGLEWMDAPYTVHLSEQFEFEEVEDGKGFALNIFLIDSSTGILEAIRLCGLSTKFSLEFQNAVQIQRNIPFDKTTYEKKINMVYGNYATSDLVQRANIYRIKE